MTSNRIAIPGLYINGLIQGIGFTTIPAAGNFLTSAEGFRLTTSEYGAIFIPMIIGSILASFLGGILGKNTSIKLVMILSGILNIFSMLIFSAGNLVINDVHYSFLTLLGGMFCLGLGFGGNITALNAAVIEFFPDRASTAVTGLHSCLGTGTAIGPLLINYFLSHHIWWVDGILIAACYAVLLVLTIFFFPHHVKTSSTAQPEAVSSKPKKGTLLLFIIIALLYGICETTFGNWGTIYLHSEKGMTQVQSNYALSIFWGTLTAGRILVFILSFKISPRVIYRILAPLILLSLIAIQLPINQSSAAAFYSIFGLAGIGCSAFLPLTVSFSGRMFFSNAEEVSGEVIATYMLGYGIASIGIGLLNKLAHIDFQSIFAWLAIPVIVLAIFCIYVTKSHKNNASSG